MEKLNIAVFFFIELPLGNPLVFVCNELLCPTFHFSIRKNLLVEF